MNNITISIFENQIFLKILKELKLFSKFNIKFYTDLDLCLSDALRHEHLIIFFITERDNSNYDRFVRSNLPIIFVNKSLSSKKVFPGNLIEQLNMPFKLRELEKKIVTLFARYEFKKSSLINLGEYIIDKNERKIKKNDLELKLTEKEINFLILFSADKKPLKRDFVLKKVWKYSSESDTHTVETHIHRLRKKILNKFNDKSFIKNNDEGYYI